MQPPEEDGAAEDMGENTAMSQQLSRPSLAEEIEKLGLFPLGHENQPDPPAITATNNVRATAAVPQNFQVQDSNLGQQATLSDGRYMIQPLEELEAGAAQDVGETAMPSRPSLALGTSLPQYETPSDPPMVTDDARAPTAMVIANPAVPESRELEISTPDLLLPETRAGGGEVCRSTFADRVHVRALVIRPKTTPATFVLNRRTPPGVAYLPNHPVNVFAELQSLKSLPSLGPGRLSTAETIHSSLVIDSVATAVLSSSETRSMAITRDAGETPGSREPTGPGRACIHSFIRTISLLTACAYR